VTDQFIVDQNVQHVDTFQTKWRAPSNIALIKYWGKHGLQLPQNPSLSFTLSECRTETMLKAERKERKEEVSFSVKYDGETKPAFEPKIAQFFNRIAQYCPWVDDYHFDIDTVNTFPHSSGIASSASSMAALSSTLMNMEAALTGQSIDKRKASFLARLGSGSACRSIEGKAVVWGQHESVEESDDLYGVSVEQKLHDEFIDYRDTILIVDKSEKSVSSSAGHQLMEGHAFAKQRFAQAHRNLDDLLDILSSGDLDGFVQMVEHEALTLHSMMMTSRPYYLLMKANTVAVIEEVFRFRESEKLPLCFTLDAGANVHLLYPKSIDKQVNELINSALVKYCQDGKYICDHMGNGASRL
jgi:diphosphomevalonate decarboxylase